MATMKEIAQKANTSLSTVSIILNGRGKERNISDKTQQAVLKAAEELNYRPNVVARKLRKGGNDTTVILIFWAEDFRASMLVRFMRGLHRGIDDRYGKTELMFHYYKAGELHLSKDKLDPSICTAAIICNTTSNDIEFLEASSFDIPLVLYNRYSQKYCTVNVPDSNLGILPAQLFLKNNYNSYITLSSENNFPGMEIRNDKFIETLVGANISKKNIHTITAENTYKSAYEQIEKHIGKLNLPAAIFCASDVIAIGAIKALHNMNLRVPQDVSIISIGNGDPELESYLHPSLSVVVLPMEKMAESCIDLCFKALGMKIKSPESIQHELYIVERESTL